MCTVKACENAVVAVQYQIIARCSSPTASTDRDITAVRYRVEGATGSCSREQMITLLEQGHTAFVTDQHGYSDVGIFDLNKVKYLRTYWGDFWDDNLILLPTFDVDVRRHNPAVGSDAQSRRRHVGPLVGRVQIAVSRLIGVTPRWRRRADERPALART
ncbi:hypothetical protein CRM90_27705 [Mycobacterium sp. ENV421]|nr:hypothetical protein CRM90_27705 [Mycobacterium sp. ENV421]